MRKSRSLTIDQLRDKVYRGLDLRHSEIDRRELLGMCMLQLEKSRGYKHEPAVIKLRYGIYLPSGRGFTHRLIARHRGLRPMHVRAIERRAIARLRLIAAGIIEENKSSRR